MVEEWQINMCDGIARPTQIWEQAG